jgi:hypothetical protein
MVISCNTPSGQIVEQYTLPKRNVKSRTKNNPMDALLNKINVRTNEGTTCVETRNESNPTGERLP